MVYFLTQQKEVTYHAGLSTWVYNCYALLYVQSCNAYHL